MKDKDVQELNHQAILQLDEDELGELKGRLLQYFKQKTILNTEISFFDGFTNQQVLAALEVLIEDGQIVETSQYRFALSK